MTTKILKYARYTFFAVAITMGVVFIPYHLAFAKKIIPNVWVGQINLGGKDLATAQNLILASFTNLEKETVAEIPLADWGVAFDAKATIVAAYQVGRSGNPIKDTKDKLTAYKNGLKIPPVFATNQATLETQLQSNFGKEEEKFQEASLTLENGQVVFKPGKEGKAIDAEGFLSCLESNLSNLTALPITCGVEWVGRTPQYTPADFKNIESKVLSLSSTEININWPGGLQTIKGAALLDLLEVEPRGLFVNLEKVTQYVENLGQNINREAVNAAFEVKEDGHLAMFTPAKEGLRLKEDNLTESLVELLDQILKTEESSRKNYFELDALTEIIKPEIVSIENDYGIKTLLGEGQSNYHGSIAGRIYNINLASKHLNGRLIEPGATVSFNHLLGEVSADTGYKAAYVIINNQTILGSGGGVCQTSTTMFRAALNAGLPILDRTAHLYRVHYYEPPLGIDATVMAPYTDLVFQNDTPAYILIQTQVDSATENVTYRIFGTSDGRQTAISEPVITNQTGYPAPIYKEDAELEKGKTAQVEWSAGGATAMVTRKVIRAGETLQDDTFVSHYVPWPAVYLVGTKESW